MDAKRTILSFFGQVKSAWSGVEVTAHEDQVPAHRLKQLETRSAGLTEGVTCEDEQLIDSIARQKTTVSENLLHWSCNPDKGMRQEIRQVHQLGGVAKGFSIDPLTDLD